MGPIKSGAVCLAAVCALGVGAASSAIALPEVGRCVTKAGGKYEDSNCSVKASKGTGTFEFVKGAEKQGFTASGGEAVLEVGPNLVCKASTETGKYDEDGAPGAIKGVEDVVMTFHGCALPTFAECNSKGHAPGEIVTSGLVGSLGYISGEKTATPVVGQELTPTVKVGAVTEFECSGGAVKVVVKAAKTNCVIAPIGPANVSSTTTTQEYRSTGSLQEPNHFQKTATKICQLEARTNGGPPEKLALKLTAAVSNEEALEIKA